MYKNNIYKNINGPATFQNLGKTGVIYISETFLPELIQNKLNILEKINGVLVFDYIKTNFLALISISVFIIYGCYEHMNTNLNSLINIFHKSKHHRNLKISNSGLLLHFIAINLLIINLVNNQIIDISIYRLILVLIISLILIIKIILMIFYK